MSINRLYIPLFTIEEVILDKDTGLPLAAGIVNFYRDSQRTTPKSVFQISGTSPNYTFTDVGPILTLGLSGTFVDGSGDPFVPYAYPYDTSGDVDLYYVTVESEGNVAQFTREAVPYIADTNVPAEQRSSTENELANPQFVEILFPTDSATTYSITGTDTVTSIAPGWDIISTGTGTLTLERLEPTAANIDTNPPYVLSIATTGFGATITLRQRLTNTPSFIRGRFASGSLLAKIISGGSSNISMVYAPSTGAATTVIPSVSITNDGAYHVIANNAEIAEQVNDAASTGYIDINIVIPTSRTIALSSIQLVGVADSVDIPFDEQTVARQIDHLFHYYKPELEYMQTPNYLVGWDFPLNPAQFLGDSVAAQPLGNNSSFYAWDSTIIYQSEDQGCHCSRDNALAFTINADKTASFAMIQYFELTQARKILNQPLSLHISALSTIHEIPITVSIWYTTGSALPDIKSPNYKSIVATLDANGKPATFNNPTAGTWTELKTVDGQTLTATIGLSATGSEFNDYTFTGYDLNDSSISNTVTFMAVVIGTSQIVNLDTLHFNSVALCAGNIPTRPAPQTADQVLRECQFFYEKSYGDSIVPGNASLLNALFAEQYVNDVAGAPHTLSLKPRSYMINYTPKIIDDPAVTFYSPTTGTSDKVHGYIVNAGSALSDADITQSSYWTRVSKGEKTEVYVINSTADLVGPTNAVVDFPEAYILFHYTIDARLGTY